MTGRYISTRARVPNRSVLGLYQLKRAISVRACESALPGPTRLRPHPSLNQHARESVPPLVAKWARCLPRQSSAPEPRHALTLHMERRTGAGTDLGISRSLFGLVGSSGAKKRHHLMVRMGATTSIPVRSQVNAQQRSSG
jgi:hypothetical protein